MRYPALLAVSLGLAPVACNTDDSSPPVGRSLEVALVDADAADVVGKVTVANSESTLRITVAADEGWTLKKVRMALGTRLGHIPQTRHGEPIPGRFPLQRRSDHDRTEEAWRFPLIVEPGTNLYFAVQAEVRKKSTKDDGKDDEDDRSHKSDGGRHEEDDKNCDVDVAWGEGEPFPKANGSMFFTYVVQSNLPPSLAGLYRTHTQDAWGALPGANNAVAYLAANFDGAFPVGLTLGGAEGYSARFTNSGAIAEFLPQAGPAASLDRNWVNPRTLDNSLAGNTTALALNVGFDVDSPDFAPGVEPLQDLVVADPASPFYGRSVGEVLSLANQALMGQSDGLFSPEEINDCVLRINQTFEDGEVDLGFVGLP